jgi:hypothetical protein
VRDLKLFLPVTRFKLIDSGFRVRQYNPTSSLRQLLGIYFAGVFLTNFKSLCLWLINLIEDQLTS